MLQIVWRSVFSLIDPQLLYKCAPPWSDFGMRSLMTSHWRMHGVYTDMHDIYPMSVCLLTVNCGGLKSCYAMCGVVFSFWFHSTQLMTHGDWYSPNRCEARVLKQVLCGSCMLLVWVESTWWPPLIRGKTT